MTRDEVRAGFLEAAGWGAADRVKLAGDASFRKYDRLHMNGEPRVLMDAPPPHEDVRPFISVTNALRSLGFSAPRIDAQDVPHGFLLLEDLGDNLYARAIAADPALEAELYAAAIDLLADMHARTRGRPVTPLPPYDHARLMTETALLWEWYLPAIGIDDSGVAAAGRAAFTEALQRLTDPVSVMVLRDFHAENLMWKPERTGHTRIGLIDYQDALEGHAAYDLVSLLKDARRDVSPALEEAMIARYLDQAAAHGLHFDPAIFRADYARLGVQRNAKIIGIFTRLDRRDGKAHYLKLIPRVWGLLDRDLQHPANEPVKAWLDEILPGGARPVPAPGTPS